MVQRGSKLRLGLIAAVAVTGGYLLLTSNLPILNGFSGEDAVPVLIVSRYVSPFSPVKADSIEVRSIPRAYVPPGALHALNELRSGEGQNRFLSAIGLPEGQPLNRAVLLDLSQSHGLASVLGPGRVAVSFSVDKVRGVGGWIQPGDHVAVFQTFREGMAGAARTNLLLSSIEVVAVNQKRLGDPEKTVAVMTDGSEDGLTLTVIVNPVQAAAIVKARENGRLSAVLLAAGDATTWSAE